MGPPARVPHKAFTPEFLCCPKSCTSRHRWKDLHPTSVFAAMSTHTMPHKYTQEHITSALLNNKFLLSWLRSKTVRANRYAANLNIFQILHTLHLDALWMFHDLFCFFVLISRHSWELQNPDYMPIPKITSFFFLMPKQTQTKQTSFTLMTKSMRQINWPWKDDNRDFIHLWEQLV